MPYSSFLRIRNFDGSMRIWGGMSMYWRTEKNRPFGGNVDSECRLNVCEELGEITFAKGEFSIPLIVDFYSGRNTKSPTMGAYWILNVADLRLLKNDVNSYSLFFPNGTESIFYKDSGKTHTVTKFRFSFFPSGQTCRR